MMATMASSWRIVLGIPIFHMFARIHSCFNALCHAVHWGGCFRSFEFAPLLRRLVLSDRVSNTCRRSVCMVSNVVLLVVEMPNACFPELGAPQEAASISPN